MASLITVDQKIAIFERLLHRNFIRGELGIRPINIPEAYQRQARFVIEKRYDEIIAPFVDAAFSIVDWPPSMAAKRCVAMQAYDKCVTDVKRRLGIPTPAQASLT